LPFKSKAQQRYLESSASPISEAQKREWESATNFSKLPEKKGKGMGKKAKSVKK